MHKFGVFAVAASIATMSTPLAASEYDESLMELANTTLADVIANPAIVAAVKAQNEAHAGIAQDKIDSLDQEWRAQVGQSSTPLIDGVLGAEASQILVDLRDESEGLLTEVFVMDNVGLNVASSDVTSDYWQGDEAKWQETFKNGAGAVHLSEVELDESTQSYQAQVSLTVADLETSEPIGAVTFGVNIEFLE